MSERSERTIDTENERTTSAESERRTLTAGATRVDGTVRVPGSKSIANRALVIAALADGDSELVGVPDGDDTVAMLAGLGELGIDLEAVAGNVLVAGGGGVVRAGGRVHAGLAGTTSRFLTAVAALADGAVVIDGDPPLRARPMAHLHAALVALGARVEHGEASGYLPASVSGPLRVGGAVSLPGDVSSQFVTALMLVAPLLDGGLRIDLTSPLVSMPYVRLTAAVMAEFGVGDIVVEGQCIRVPAGRYHGCRFTVEPDASSASYPLAIAAARGGSVTIVGLTTESRQGDIAIVDLLAAMGCAISTDASAITVGREVETPLLGIDVDMADISDLVPTIAAAASTATSPTTIRGVGFIRTKESDRLGDLTTELRKAGASIEETDDGLRIDPVDGGAAGLHSAVLSTHHDHRLAMAFAVLGSVVDGIVVEGAGVVSKSWPGFWAAYDDLLAR